MTLRRLDERVRVTLPTRPITCSVTPRQVEKYMLATGWRPRDDGSGSTPDAEGRTLLRLWIVQDPRDRTVPLADVIKEIARHEKRYPGEVLADIAAGKGFERALRMRKKWPSWP